MVADRVTLLLLAVVAVIIARNPDSSVFNIVSFAGLDLVLYWTGCIVCFVLETYELAGCTGRNDFWWCYGICMEIPCTSKCIFLNFYELLPAFLVSCAMIVIVSLANKGSVKRDH